MTTHTYKGKEYLHLKWLEEDMCDGCAFRHMSNCPNADEDAEEWFNQCEGSKGRLAALLWIENTPESIAAYMAERMK